MGCSRGDRDRSKHLLPLASDLKTASMAKSGKVGTMSAKKTRSASAVMMVKDKRHALSNIEEFFES